METPREQETTINIELSEELAEGEYANLVMIGHSPEEFIFDFIRVVPGLPKARVKARIVLTPQHARRFLRALQENIERYERAFGPIVERGGGMPAVRFQIPGGEA